MIRSFVDELTAALYRNEVSRLTQAVAPGLRLAAARKLHYLQAATRLGDLLVPPGNRLEALKGDQKGRYSIRVNNQWRITFVWKDGGAEQVAFVDYHQ
jgi:proteic killer suppression protein